MLLYTEDDYKGLGITIMSWTYRCMWFVLYATSQQRSFEFGHLYKVAYLELKQEN